MFKVTLCTISEYVKQSKYSKTGEWINKFWYIQMIEYNSAIKRMKYKYIQQQQQQNRT